MKKALRWICYVLAALILLAVIALLSLDSIAKSTAEKRIRAETGMEAKIGKFNLGLTSRTLHIQDFTLINPPEFGGSTFVEIPELFVELDFEAFRQNKLRLKNVRFNLAEIHIVETKDGKKNTDVFEKQGDAKKGDKKSSVEQLQFAGIDRLEVSLGRTKFTSERYPKRNFDRNLGVQNRVFNDIKTEQDLQTVGMVLAAQAGLHMLLDGVLKTPGNLVDKSAPAAKEAKEVLKDIVAPFKTEKKQRDAVR